MLILELLFRGFGVLWIFGGALTIQHARMGLLIDQALVALTQEQEDKLVSYFLLFGGILTLLSGVGLALVSRWLFLPLGLLIGSQVIYFALQHQRLLKAQTDQQRQEATVEPSTRNAFVVSLWVAIAALVGLSLGILK
jgi:uncharacterized membrane protein